MASKYLIYALVDPRTGQWRYVGKSSSGLCRPRSHGGAWAGKNEAHFPVHRWIKKLRDVGASFDILVLEEVSSDRLAESEREWISEARHQGVALLNLTDGGEGSAGIVQSKETREKHSRSLSFLVRPPRIKKERVRVRAAGAGGFRPGAPLAKPIIDDLGRRYDSCGAAAKVLGVDRALVRRVVQGKQKSVRGRIFYWEIV